MLESGHEAERVIHTARNGKPGSAQLSFPTMSRGNAHDTEAFAVLTRWRTVRAAGTRRVAGAADDSFTDFMAETQPSFHRKPEQSISAASHPAEILS